MSTATSALAFLIPRIIQRVAPGRSAADAFTQRSFFLPDRTDSGGGVRGAASGVRRGICGAARRVPTEVLAATCAARGFSDRPVDV